MGAPPHNDSAGLALHGIGVRFGGLTALDDVSLTVPDGRIVGVIGPNGAGKTTVFNVVCGFVAPQTGTLSLDGQPLRPRPHRLNRLGIARTLQGVGLFAGLSLVENVMAGATHTARSGLVSAFLGLPPSAREERRLRADAMELLDELGIAAHASALPGTLPYPIQKKAGLARALAARPRLLLLDEPAGGLGAEDIGELAALIRRLPTRDEACAVLLVEHHMDLVMAVCDEIVVLDFGRVVATGTPDQIREDPAVAAAYLGTDATDAAPEATSGADRADAATADASGAGPATASGADAADAAQGGPERTGRAGRPRAATSGDGRSAIPTTSTKAGAP